MRRDGLALIVVAGVLGILAVLAAAFVTMAQLERRASRQRLHVTKATLLARSGIEDAVARLGAGQDPDLPGTRYGGEDWLLDGDQGPGSFDRQQEVYGPGRLDVESCPARQALRPSFFVRRPSFFPDQPRLEPVAGRQRGHSGRLAGDLAAGGNGSARRGMSPGGIHVTGGGPLLASAVGYNAVLRRILGTLAKGVGEAGQPVAEADGWALVDARPLTARGWRDWEQLRDLALGGSRLKLDALKPYLALEAWTDTHVIRPNPAPDGVRYYTWADFKKAKLAPSTGLAVPDFERMPVAPGGRIVGRAPVDFQWARHRRPVLRALIRGLAASYLCRSDRGLVAAGFPVGMTRAFGFTTDAIDLQAADQVADQILASDREIETWAQWESLCSDLALPYGAVESVPRARVARGILMANFNPNTDLAKFNPDTSRYRLLDKSDLVAYSTEFDLRSNAPMALEASGRVLSAEGRVLAERTLQASLSRGKAVRLTTQREFLAEDLGDLDLPGDEGAPRLPGFRAAGAPGCISESRGVERTWGHRVDMTAAYPGTWMDGDSGGLSLQSHPEPCTDRQDGSGPAISPADYDGCLRLATVETRDDTCYDVTATTATLMMLARFGTGLDLDVAAAEGPPLNLPGARRNIPTPALVATTELGLGLLDPTKPNTLYPDGCYSEYGRAPAWYDRGNAHGRHGVISFWFKPDDYYNNGRYRTFVKWTNFQEATYSGVASPNQFFFLGWAGWSWMGTRPYVEGPFCQFETWRGLDTGHEFQFHTDGVQSPVTGRWTLLTLFYDFEGASPDACAELVLDGGGTPGVNVASNDDYQSTTAGVTTDITESSDLFGPEHRIVLGSRRWPYDGATWNAKGSQGNADATIDEFAIYDFGQDEASAAVLAANRYKEGRYYKGSAYSGLVDPYSPPVDAQAPSYFTAPIRLPAGAWLKRVSWTFHAGKDLPDDYAEVALVDPDGSGYLGEAGPDGSALTRSVKHPAWRPSAQSWRVAREVSSPFRLQVVFRRDVPVDEDAPILDSPTLDDLTITYEIGRGPRLLSWGAAE